MIEQQLKKEGVPYVKVEDLKTQFFTSKGIVKAIDGVSFEIYPGEIFGLVGESGCGKSVTSLSIMDLIPDPPGRIIGGKIYIDGFNIISDLDKLVRIKIKSETEVKVKRYKSKIKRHNFILSKIRGDKIAMIFQEPFLALNPVIRVGDQISESILLHNTVEISNSIIRRETIKKEDADKFVQRVLDAKDPDAVRKEINRWTREYGIPNAESSINDLFKSSDDREYISKEIFELVVSEKKGTNLDNVVKTRDYHKYQNRLLELNLALLEAESTRNEDKIQDLEYKIKTLRSEIRSKFLGYMIMSKIRSRSINKPYVIEARRRTLELLELVNIAGAERVIDSYPHELSGGMQQRAMIAMALSSNPKILIADEPTTALDVTTQAQILELIRDLNNVIGTSVLFITHDLAVIAEMCSRVGVMYAGNLVEEAEVEEIFSNPKHPYTMGLMNAIPRADRERNKMMKLESIPGMVPNLITPPSGCRFHPRCKFAMDVCSEKKPKLVKVEEGHKVACFLYSNEAVEAN